MGPRIREDNWGVGKMGPRIRGDTGVGLHEAGDFESAGEAAKLLAGHFLNFRGGVVDGGGHEVLE